jgi:hypothetical protein
MLFAVRKLLPLAAAVALVCALFWPSHYPLYAAARQKASVAVIVVNNAGTDYDAELTEKMADWVKKKFDGVYDVRPAAPFVARLRAAGAADLDAAKKAAVGETFRSEAVDYVVYIELKPFTVDGHVALFRYGRNVTADILVRMYDVVRDQYLHDATLSRQAAKDEQSVFLDERIVALFTVNTKKISLRALDNSLFHAGEIISVKLPLDPRPERSQQAMTITLD